MSGPVRETLDETIDRVAATLTAVPADPGFTQRLAPRLTRERPGWNHTWLVGAAAAAVIFVALLVNNGRDASVNAPLGVVAENAPAAPLVQGTTASVIEEPTVEQTTASVDPAPAVVEVNEPAPPPAIAALAAPEGIGVETLQLEALAVMPVEIGEIDIASLEVREIDGFEDPKE